MQRLPKANRFNADLDLEWANSTLLPVLLVATMILITAQILPDDLPLQAQLQSQSARK